MTSLSLLQKIRHSDQEFSRKAGIYGEEDVVDMMKDFRKKRAKKK